MSENVLRVWQKRLLCNLVSYYKDGNHYRFENKKNEWHLVESATPKLIQVVAREHYSEQVDKLPVTEQKSISSLLKLRKQKHESQCYAAQVRAKEDSVTLLNSWLFDTKLDGSLIVLPESLLIAHNLSDTEVLLVNDKYFLAKRNNVIYSAAKFGLVNSVERFANTVGIRYESENELHSEASLIKRLVDSIYPVLMNYIAVFFQTKGVNFYRSAFKKSGLLVAGGCAAYIGLSSLYLFAQKSYSQSKLIDNQATINQALATFADYETRKNSVEQWQSIFQKMPKISPNLLILESLRAKANIESIQYKGERFVVKGKSTNSISVLESLSQFNWVVEPKFDFPVRSYQGTEEFVISYTVAADAHKAMYNANKHLENDQVAESNG
ncbi:hypothetical protein [Pseudoalteromonas sp. S16_S37]|uniref:hypothetical protein n=1 Tax=Pseudoalteromonas sp. S16_S37 TaxID=2720228 RepID=UPI0016817865|nr:hypothetical protein [Pseudoalteromonas sp. S16_S37]MBD1580974.1 hypothetical protein [Pseudoalteromonas sp. S16_S37]